jgi:glycosyltransferase involved in cell wall biosynthesis
MQTYANFEALIIDGSTDDTSNLIDEFVHYDHRFTSYKIQNLGPGFARNLGIDKAKGKYVTFMDHDDMAAENWLSELHAIATREETDITFCSGFDFSGDTVSLLELPPISDSVYTLNDTIRNQISCIFIAPWLKLIPLDFITKNKLKFSLDNKFDDVLFHFCAIHAAQKNAFT